MPFLVGCIGFDVAAIYAAAKAQPNGSQKLKFCELISSYIGANPNARIIVGSGASATVVYAAGTVGALAYSANGITIPLAFNEPPTTNIANALTDPSTVFELRSTVTPSRSIQAPLALLMTGNPARLLISDALDGVKFVRAQTILIAPPDGLDAATTTPTGNILAAADPSLSIVEGWIRSATMPDQGSSSRYSAYAWTNQPGQAFFGSAAGLFALCAPAGDLMTSNGGLDGCATWNWADLAAGHAGSNTELQTIRNESFVLMPGGSWDRLWVAAVGGGGARWVNGGIPGFDAPMANRGGQIRAYTVGLQANDLGSGGQENWPEGFLPTVDAYRMQAARCYHTRTLVRVAKSDPSGPDNRSAARFRFKVGADVFNSKHPNFPARGNVNTGNPWKRPEQGTMPGYCMDGWMCSWHVIPFNPANPDAWYSVAATTFTPCYYPAAGLHSAVASAHGLPGGYSTPSPWAQGQYAITHSEFRTNPPPLPSLA